MTTDTTNFKNVPETLGNIEDLLQPFLKTTHSDRQTQKQTEVEDQTVFALVDFFYSSKKSVEWTKALSAVQVDLDLERFKKVVELLLNRTTLQNLRILKSFRNATAKNPKISEYFLSLLPSLDGRSIPPTNFVDLTLPSIANRKVPIIIESFSCFEFLVGQYKGLENLAKKSSKEQREKLQTKATDFLCYLLERIDEESDLAKKILIDLDALNSLTLSTWVQILKNRKILQKIKRARANDALSLCLERSISSSDAKPSNCSALIQIAEYWPLNMFQETAKEMINRCADANVVVGFLLRDNISPTKQQEIDDVIDELKRTNENLKTDVDKLSGQRNQVLDDLEDQRRRELSRRNASSESIEKAKLQAWSLMLKVVNKYLLANLNRADAVQYVAANTSFVSGLKALKISPIGVIGEIVDYKSGLHADLDVWSSHVRILESGYKLDDSNHVILPALVEANNQE